MALSWEFHGEPVGGAWVDEDFHPVCERASAVDPDEIEPATFCDSASRKIPSATGDPLTPRNVSDGGGLQECVLAQVNTVPGRPRGSERSFAGEHGGGFAFEVEVGFAADVDRDLLDGAA